MKLKLRKNVDEQYKWDLSAIIPNDEEWEKLINVIDAEAESLGEFKSRLNDNQVIKECLVKEDEVGLVLERLYVYAKMRLDEDSNITKYQDFTDRAERLAVKISTITSYIVPELTKMDTEELLQLARSDEFKDYSYLLENIARNKEHILSKEEEKILSETGSFSDGFHDIFNMLDNADIQFGNVTFNGEKVTLTHATYSMIMQSDDEKARKVAFRKMFGAYKNYINTIATIYAGNVKKDCFYAKVRNYPSALDKAMFGENVPSTIYYNLLESVNDSLPLMHDYIEFRKKSLGCRKYYMWDMHTSIIEGESVNRDYEEAKKLVKEALEPLGNDYASLLDSAFNDKWIDVYENKGKRSGAYSWGSYNAHPYVLLNYNGTTHDVFTIAHELGHAMHSYYSNKSQPYVKAGYEIFVAEIASTVNEVLLLKHLIKNAEGNTKKYLLSYYLDMFRTTLYRQTQFAEFEMIAHKHYEDGDSLTQELLCDEYQKLNEKYYGAVVEKDNFIRYEWARIPHFYRSFYVYKYATGITSAIVIANKILKDTNYVDKYKKFLSLGGSMPPNDILKIADVDLEDKRTFEIAFGEFRATLDELKKL